MKLTIDVEEILVEEILIEKAKEEIMGYYYEALDQATKNAEKDMDRISRNIILLVKRALKDI